MTTILNDQNIFTNSTYMEFDKSILIESDAVQPRTKLWWRIAIICGIIFSIVSFGIALGAIIYKKNNNVETTNINWTSKYISKPEKKRLLSLEQQLMDFNQTIIKLKRKFNKFELCPNGMIFGDQCITLAYTQGISVTYPEAETYCENLGAVLAEVTSKEMFDKVYAYVWSTWIRYTHRKAGFIDVWLRSTFQPLNNTEGLITLANGTSVNLSDWASGFPKTGNNNANLVNVAIIVRRPPHTYDTGLANFRPTQKIPVPLCSRTIYNVM